MAERDVRLNIEARGGQEAARALNQVSAAATDLQAKQTAAARDAATTSERTRAILRGMTEESRRAATAPSPFASLANDVRLASADFRAGRISIHDYRTALAVAREETIRLRDSGITPTGAQVAQFNAAMGATAVQAGVSQRGLGTVRSALGSLAAQSLATKGSFGTLASGMLAFSTSTLTGIGVLAGLAAVAALYKKLTEASDAAAESLKRTREELAKAQVTPRAAALEKLGELRERETAIENATVTVAGGAVVPLTQIKPEDRTSSETARLKELEFIRISITQAQKELDRATIEGKEKVAKAAQEVADSIRDFFTEVERRVQAEVDRAVSRQKDLLGQLDEFKPGVVGQAPGRNVFGEVRPDLIDEGRKAGEEAQDSARRALDPARAVPHIQGRLATIDRQLDERESARLAATSHNFEAAAAVGVSALGGLAAAALSGGNAFQAATVSISSAISQIATSKENLLLGGVVGALGGIFGSLLGHKKDPVPVRVEEHSDRALNQQRSLILPVNVALQLVSSSTGEIVRQVLYAARDFESRDGIIRLPPDVAFAYGR